MDEQIWKYQLELTDLQSVWMPAGAHILSAANQNGTLCIWAWVNAAEKTMVCKHIEIIGTGNPIWSCGSRRFIGTVLMSPFVWHVFEREG